MAVLGDSHGGATAATLVLQPFAGSGQRADPGGGRLLRRLPHAPAQYGGLPLLALAGNGRHLGATRPGNARRFAAAVPPGSPVTLGIYPDVVHGFENPRNVQRSFSEGHPMQFDRSAANDSYEKVHAFLDRTIGPAH